jgi:hypothetical protein
MTIQMTIGLEHIPHLYDVIRVDGRQWKISHIISVSADKVSGWNCKIKVDEVLKAK